MLIFVYCRTGTDRTGLSSLSSRPPLSPPPLPSSPPDHSTRLSLVRNMLQAGGRAYKHVPSFVAGRHRPGGNAGSTNHAPALLRAALRAEGGQPMAGPPGTGLRGTRQVCLNKVDTLKQTRYSLVYIAGKMGRTNSSL